MVVVVVANVGVVMLTPEVVDVVVETVAMVMTAPGLDLFDEVPSVRKTMMRAMPTTTATAVENFVTIARLAKFFVLDSVMCTPSTVRTRLNPSNNRSHHGGGRAIT